MLLPITRKQQIALLFILALSISACGGLGGEPEIRATLPLASPLAPSSETNFPPQTPDIARGAQIFIQNCARCHGERADGRGELVLSGQVPAIPSFKDPQTSREQTPAEYYEIITNGRIENLMPPWREALTEQERWDVALYVYTLHYTQEQLALGQQIWGRECADCHGDDGRGRGPEMRETGRSAGDLTDHTRSISLSDHNVDVIIAEGAGNAMPAFSDLAETEIRAVIAYVRALALQNAEFIGTEPAQIASSADSGNETQHLAQIRGTVINGTEGASVPPDFAVSLRYGNPEAGITNVETAIDENGNFLFEDIPVNQNYEYVTVGSYQDRFFISEVITGDPNIASYELPITIYEIDEDPSNIFVSNIDMMIEFIDGGAERGNGLLVSQIITYTNQSDRVYSTSRSAGNNRFASLLVLAPQNAEILNNPNNQRYLIAREQNAIIDTAPVFPGEGHTIQTLYFQPYQDRALLEQPWNNPVNADIQVSISPNNLQIINNNLRPEPDAENSPSFRVYKGEFSLPAAGTLQLEIVGDPLTAASANETPIIVSANHLLLLTSVILLALAAIVLFIVHRQRAAGQNLDSQINHLARQIAKLDVAHERGEINHDLYRQQRKTLKAKLAALIAQDQNENPDR